jgi:two-component system osmolarity sensor histidine kinase EnvZ
MLAGISHDLRSPLARIRLALALLEVQPTPALIARIDRDVEQMNDLIGDVLSLARGLASEAPEDIDLGRMVSQIASNEYEGRVEVVVPEQSVRISARPLALHRVLCNLIDNAVRYGEGKPVQVRVTHDSGNVRIGVLDCGSGIPEDQLRAVLQPFHRVDESRSPTSGGTGLGLAIVQQLAIANNWQITLENRTAGGLAASITLTG